MARIRTIKPEFWSDPIISKMPIFTAFFYIALWNFADDAGRGRANAKELNGLIFSDRDDVENRQVEEALQHLHDLGRIILYTPDDKRLFQIVKWAHHQVINRPSRSRFPAPEGFMEVSPQPEPDSLNTHGDLTEATVNPQSMESGRRKAEGGSGKLEMGRRKAEGGAEEGGSGETTAPQPTASRQVSAPPPRPPFSEQAPVPPKMPALPEQPPPERVITVCLEQAEWTDLLSSGPPGGPPWRRDEIWTGLEILSERKEPPRDAAALLHSKLLPEVRAGTKKPVRLANAPPPPAPTTTDEEIARIEATRAARWAKIHAAAPFRSEGEGEQSNADTNGTTGTGEN